MIKVENIEVFNFEGAIRGMRNPLNSHDKSDSGPGCKDGICTMCGYFNACTRKEKYNTQSYHIGENDLSLMKKLYKAGVEHRTYARMIMVSMDITAPLYYWKEADRYSIGKTQVSTSTMHTIHKKPFEIEDFSHEHLISSNGKNGDSLELLENHIIPHLNYWRERFLENQEKKYAWWQIIQTLPSSYNQKRTICMSYEVVFKIIKERSNHKLDEWVEFCKILRQLPYVEEIMEEVAVNADNDNRS